MINILGNYRQTLFLLRTEGRAGKEEGGRVEDISRRIVKARENERKGKEEIIALM